MQQQNRDGEPGLPWAFAIDPVANVRALGEVQRRGLHAASQAVDRLLTSMGPEGVPRTSAAADSSADSSGSDSEVRRLAGLWTELVTRGFAEIMRMGRSEGSDGSVPTHAGDAEPPVWVDLGSGRSVGSVELVADASGSIRSSGEMWLFNSAGDPRGPIRLHAGELRSPNGCPVPTVTVLFDPPVIEELPGRSGRAVDVSLCEVDAPVPGLYRGLIQAAGAPAVTIKIELTIEQP